MIYTIIILGLVLLHIISSIRHEKKLTMQQIKFESYIEANKERSSKRISELEKQNISLKKDSNSYEDFFKFCFEKSNQIMKVLYDKWNTKKSLDNLKEALFIDKEL